MPQSTQRAMRRKDRELSREETLTVIRHTPHCVIATVDESGTPYATPITAVLFEGAVYFHSSSDVTGRRYQNALQNDKVSIVWIGRGETAADELPKDFSVNYASAIVEGRISLVTDEGEKKRVARHSACDTYLRQEKKQLTSITPPVANMSYSGK